MAASSARSQSAPQRSASTACATRSSEFKNAGYEVFLVLEATVGFNKRGDESGENETEGTPASSRLEFQTAGTLKWTSQDQRFLRALKISVDEEAGS